MELNKKYNFTSFEPLIIIAFWALLFASPLLFGRFENQIDWSHIQTVWLNYLPLLGVFLINRFLLLPKLFFKGKKVWYFAAIGSVILITAFVFYSVESNKFESNRSPRPNRIEHRESRERPPRNMDNRFPPEPSGPARPQPIPPYANFLILAILLVGFDAGLQISIRWSKLEQEKFKLQKESVENQLAFLKNQVSPHFFMNTLNNIHALVDIDTEQAKNAVIKLSNLMRHLLYDSEEKTNPIKKEVTFIKSYIELMKLRYSDKVKITVDIPAEIPEKSIPPLLFTSLLENAFKHGISYKSDSFIKVSMLFNEDKLYFEIANSNHKKETDEASGIGLKNTKKRLDLLYKDNYTYNVIENENTFKVELNLPL